jgi:hypothetical protein
MRGSLAEQREHGHSTLHRPPQHLPPRTNRVREAPPDVSQGIYYARLEADCASDEEEEMPILHPTSLGANSAHALELGHPTDDEVQRAAEERMRHPTDDAELLAAEERMRCQPD